MKPKSIRKRKGAALVVSILLAAIIGSAAIGLTAIAFRQVNIAETYNNGLAAYYAAESGIEQGLLYYKFDKNAEYPAIINTTYSPDPAKLLRRPANAYRNYMNEPTTMRKPLHSPEVDSDKTGIGGDYSSTGREQVYALQSFYKQSLVGDDTKNLIGIIDGNDLKETTNSTYKIDKDNEAVFTVNSDPADKSVNQIFLYWRWVSPNCNGLSRAVEVKLKVKEVSSSGQDEYTALFKDPRCPNILRAETPSPVSGIPNVFTPLSGSSSSLQAAMNPPITSLTVMEMSLKPVGNTANSGDGIYFGFSQGPANKRYTSGLNTTVQSIGYFAGNSRQIIANVDRQTGTIQDIFNYVVYKGGN